MKTLKSVLLIALSNVVTVGVSVGVTAWAMKKKVISATCNVLNEVSVGAAKIASAGK